jgi:hypothetical protein
MTSLIFNLLKFKCNKKRIKQNIENISEIKASVSLTTYKNYLKKLKIIILITKHDFYY